MVPLILGVMVVIVIIAGVLLLTGSRDDEIDERLDALSDFTGEYFVSAEDGGDEQRERRTARDVMSEGLDRVVAGRGFAEQMRAQLRKADLKLTVGEYLMLHVVTLVLGGLLGYMIWQSVVLAAVAAVAGLFVPRLYVGIQRNRRLRAFDNQLSDVLNLWVNALRSGYSVLQAMEAIAAEAPAPASAEFKRVVQEVQLGVPVSISFENMLKRVESEDLDMVFTAVNIQREVGGNLAEILEVIAHTIRERIRIKGEIRTLTAQGRITGYLISALPIILTLFLYAINKPYMSQLFEGPPWIVQGLIPCGWPIIGLGLIMIAVGAAIIRRIVDIEV